MFSNYIIVMLFIRLLTKLCYFYTKKSIVLNINLTQNIQLT